MRGQFAPGARIAPEGRWWAAVLALGPDAFLSHHSAADAFGRRKSASGGRNGRKRHAGVRVHRPLGCPPSTSA